MGLGFRRRQKKLGLKPIEKRKEGCRVIYINEGTPRVGGTGSSSEDLGR